MSTAQIPDYDVKPSLKTTMSDKQITMPQSPDRPRPSGGDEIMNQSLEALGGEILNPFSSWPLFWKPRFLASSPALVHLPFLFWLVQTHAPRRIVQLGVGDGVGYLGLCQAVDKLELGVACTGISLAEHEQKDSEAAAEHNKRFYDNFSTLLTEKLLTAHRHFRGGGIDLLVINTRLDCERAELLSENWNDLLSERALVVVLDSVQRMEDEGAANWLDPMLAKYPGIELEQGDGLLTLMIGRNQDERLRRLAELQLGAPGYAEARQVYRLLGEGLVARATAEELSGANEQLKKASNELDKTRKSEEDALKQLANAQARCFDLQVQLAEAKKAEALRSEYERKLAAIEQALFKTRDQNTVAEKRMAQERETLNALIAEKDQAVAGKEEETMRKEEEKAQLQARYHERLIDIAELGHKIARLDRQLKLVRQQHEDSVMRQHVLAQLGQTHTQLKMALAQNHRRRAHKRAKARIALSMSLIGQSGLFHADWYLENYPDVAESCVDPLRHYVVDGAYELRDPGPKFSAFRYHQANPDVTGEGIPALQHYLMNGRQEGRCAFRVGEGG